MKGGVSMARWLYELSNSDLLRDAEEREEYLGALLVCWNEVVDLFPDDDYIKREYDDATDEIENCSSQLEQYDDEDTHEYVDETIDELLSDFYDVCDSYRIWVKP